MIIKIKILTGNWKFETGNWKLRLLSSSIKLMIFLFPYLNIYSQVKTAEVKLDKHEELVEIINLGIKGFLIETINTSNYQFNLRYYSSELEKQWSTPINLLDAKFTTSANHLSDYAYITNQTYQIDLKNKEVKKFIIPEVLKGRVLKSDFMDSKYWYKFYYVKFSGEYLMRRVDIQLQAERNYNAIA